MTSKPDLQAITIHILPNISQIKSNSTMEIGQLIEYNKRNIFLQKLCKKWGRETSSRPLFINWRSLIWGKSLILWSVTYLQNISVALKLAYSKNKLYKILNYWSREMLNFDFSEKSLERFSTTFCVRFFKKKVSHGVFY